MQGLKRFQNIVINVEVTENAKKKAELYQVTKKFEKQIEFLKVDTRHHSLYFRPLEEEKAKNIWKFRIDKHYWGLMIKDPNKSNTLRVYDVIKHL